MIKITLNIIDFIFPLHGRSDGGVDLEAAHRTVFGADDDGDAAGFPSPLGHGLALGEGAVAIGAPP